MGGAPLPLEAEDFLIWLAAERGRSANTLEAYRRDLLGYQAFLDRSDRTLRTVATDDVVAHVRELQERGLAPATVARSLVAVRSLHAFLADEGVTDQDPAADVERPAVPQGLPKALGEDEVAALLDSVVGEDQRIEQQLFGGIEEQLVVGIGLFRFLDHSVIIESLC